MRVGVLNDRAVIVQGDRAIDVERASEGAFGPAPSGLYERWAEFRAWAQTVPAGAGEAFDAEALMNPVPEPAQVFAIGLNYAAHAAESKYDVPDFPPVFTKFRTSLAGPRGDVGLYGPKVDWEVELVAVIGKGGWRIDEADGWDHVAGLSVGQDISERATQFNATPPQFSLGKSYPGYTPIGPVVVTPDEFDDRDDLELGCEIDGERMQHGRTSQMVFSVPQLISRLSHITPLLAGDVVFTGTPAGVGIGREPQRFLQEGEVLRSYVTGIGELSQRFVDPSRLQDPGERS